MNTRSKMWKTNAKARRFLESRGITHIFCVPHSRFSKDAWGVADMFYIEGNEIRLAQLKTNAWGDLRACRKFADDTGVPIVVMMFRDREDTPRVRTICKQVSQKPNG